jgi:hypothetical protein
MMKIELPDETIRQIILQDITWQYECLDDRLQDINKGRSISSTMFSVDQEEEKQKLTEMINAMRLVLSWYGD